MNWTSWTVTGVTDTDDLDPGTHAAVGTKAPPGPHRGSNRGAVRPGVTGRFPLDRPTFPALGKSLRPGHGPAGQDRRHDHH